MVPTRDTPELSGQLELAKWIAILAMVVDHTGFIFYDTVDYPLCRAIGRLTWPLLGWIIAIRLVQKPARAAGYLKWTLAFGIITQPLYWLVFESGNGIAFLEGMLNIMFTIALGVMGFMVLESWRAGKTPGHRVLCIALAALLGVLSLYPVGVDYMLMGAAMIPLLTIAVRASLPASALVAGVLGMASSTIAMNTVGDPLMTQAVVAGTLLSGLVAWTCLQMPVTLPRLPRWFFYAFYPAHILTLLLIRIYFFPSNSIN